MTAKQSKAHPASTSLIRWSFVIAGFLLLAISSYFDNARGPILPLIMQELHLNYALSGWFLGAGHTAAALSILLTIPWLNRYSERSAAVIACSVGVACGVVSLLVQDFTWLMLLAALIGAATSLMGSMCSVLVVEGTPIKHQSRMLSALHAIYGLSSMSAAQIVAISIRSSIHWSWLYAAVIPLLFGLIFFISRRMRVVAKDHANTNPVERRQRMKLTGLEILAIITFSCYVVAEVMSSMWLSSYLVAHTKMDTAEAATYLSAFFFVLLITRLLCVVFTSERFEHIILMLALIVPLCAFAVGYSGHLWAFALVGMVGPFFPLFTCRIRRVFHESWRTVTLCALASIQVSLGFVNIGLANLADKIGMRSAFALPMLVLVTAILLLSFYLWREKRSYS